MLRAALGFFIIALVAFALGAGGIGGVSMEIGRTLLFVFLVLAVLSFLASLISGRRPNLAIAPFLLAGLLPFGLAPKAQADVSTGTKVENKAGDLSTDSKVEGRKIKGTLRDKTGQGSVLKDAKDVGVNAKDKTANAIDKGERDLKDTKKD